MRACGGGSRRFLLENRQHCSSVRRKLSILTSTKPAVDYFQTPVITDAVPSPDSL